METKRIQTRSGRFNPEQLARKFEQLAQQIRQEQSRQPPTTPCSPSPTAPPSSTSQRGKEVHYEKRIIRQHADTCQSSHTRR